MNDHAVERHRHLVALEECLLFRGLPVEKLTKLVECCTLHSVNKGVDILTEGAEDKDLSVIIDGYAIIHKEEAAGRRLILEFCGKGYSIGEFALAGETNRIATVTAITGMQILKIKGELVTEVLMRNNTFLRNLLKKNVEIIDRLDERLIAASYKTINNKISNLKLNLHRIIPGFSGDFKDLPFKMTHEMVADYCGCSRETISRIL